MLNQLPLTIPQEKIIAFCQRHHIQKMALFGSVLREDFRPESDLDILVEFDPNHTPGLDFFTMQQELAQILGQSVDLNTPNFISSYFRDEVQQEAVIIYDRT